ncbi:MAG: hypothetical protein IJ224_08635 [Lachnospiraceae bacterium]|nr:hypothetical protein [Lachnospiraceae bacterium]
MDNNNFTQNNNQNDTGWQNNGQQDVYQQGMNQQGMNSQGMNPQGMNQNGMYQQNPYQQNMYQQNMGQQNAYQQGMNQQIIGQQNAYQQGMYQQGMVQQNTYQQGMAQQGMYQQGNQPGLTRKEFINLPRMSNIKKNINSCVFAFYIVSGINFVMGLVGTSPAMVYFDVAFVFLMGLLLQMTYSKIVGLLSLGYGILNMIIFIIYVGYPGGYLIVIIGMLATSATFKFDKAWGEYINTGKKPFNIK